MSKMAKEEEGHTIKIMMVCEQCKEEFELKFESPLAVQCSKCGSLFDARLQMYKQMRKMFEQQVEGGH